MGRGLQGGGLRQREVVRGGLIEPLAAVLDARVLALELFEQSHDADLLATALREANEEVGVMPGQVEVISKLGRAYSLPTQTIVTPYVGWIDPAANFKPQLSEIEKIMAVSLNELVSPAVYHSELWTIAGQSRRVHFFELEEETIWGLTGRVLWAFLDAIFRDILHIAD